MKDLRPEDAEVLAALARRASDTLREFHYSRHNQRDGLDILIQDLSDLVDDLKDLRNG